MSELILLLLAAWSRGVYGECFIMGSKETILRTTPVFEVLRTTLLLKFSVPPYVKTLVHNEVNEAWQASAHGLQWN